MIVGVDASNVRAGGGVTHLSSLLGAADPAAFGIERIVVWAGRATLERLPEAAWLGSVPRIRSASRYAAPQAAA